MVGAVLAMGWDRRLRVKLMELGWWLRDDTALEEGAVVVVVLVAAGEEAAALELVAGGGSIDARPRLAARARNLLPACAVREVVR